MSLVKNPEILALLAPISQEDSVGVFNEDDEIYTMLEDEMIQLGGLQQASINWDKVEERSKYFLQKKCKHFRVANYLALCWIQQETSQTWCKACDLLTGFCEDYFVKSHPKPGELGLPFKHKMVSTLIARLKTPLEALLDLPQEKEEQTKWLQAISNLAKVCVGIGCSQDDESILAGMHKKIDATLKTPQPSPNKPVAPTSQQKGKTLNTSFFSSAHNAEPSISDRELRKTLLSIAQSANLHDAYDPVGYSLRRYALWGPITSSPITTKGQQTELMPAPREIVDEYQNALDNNKVDPALLQRVENSVVSSIFWLKGSYYACEFANRLEMQEVANAIRNSTLRFVTKLPILLKLQFSDGSPFADEITTRWISAPVVAATTPIHASAQMPPSVEADYLKLYKKLSKQMDQDGIESALKALEDLQSQTTSPRKLHQTMKITADLLNNRGLNWLAQNFYQRIEQTMTEIRAAQWEPELYAQVCQKAGKQNKTKGDNQP